MPNKVPFYDAEMIVRILYTNWKGETAWRNVVPIANGGLRDGRPSGTPEFVSSEWHPEKQWILLMWDVDKQDFRSFAMKDIQRWEPVKSL